MNSYTNSLANRDINLFNVHSALWSFAANTVNIFGPIYMLQMGISLPVVALIWGFSYTARFLLRPFSLLLVEKIGLKKSLILGSIIYAGLLPVIYQVREVGGWMWFMIFYLALSDIMYFLPYHSLYAGLGDHDQRGKQLAVKNVSQLLFATAAPIVGGILAVTFGFKATYIGATLVAVGAVLPLFFLQDYKSNIAMGFPEAYRSIDFRGFWTMTGDGIKVQIETFIWIVSIFFLTTNLINFGWLVGLQTFLTTLFLLILGRLIDGGKGKKILLIGSVGMGLMFLARAFLVSDVTHIILAQIALAVILVFYEMTFDTVFYNMAKQTKSTLWFHFFGEAGADVGNGVMFFLTALLVSLGLPIQYLLAFGVLGLFIVTPILTSYFRTQAHHVQ